MRSPSCALSSLSAAAFLALAFSETHLPKAFLEPSSLTARHSSTAWARACLVWAASSVAVFLAVWETHLPKAFFFVPNIVTKLVEPAVSRSALQYFAAFLESAGVGSAAEAAAGEIAKAERAAATRNFFMGFSLRVMVVTR